MQTTLRDDPRMEAIELLKGKHLDARLKEVTLRLSCKP